MNEIDGTFTPRDFTDQSFYKYLIQYKHLTNSAIRGQNISANA